MSPGFVRLSAMREIVEAAGGVEGLRKRTLDGDGSFHVKNTGYMDLVVEHVGTMAGCALVSFAHYYPQNGDLMRDPEIVFMVTPAGDWIVQECTQDPMGAYTRVRWEEGGKIMLALGAERGVRALAVAWDRNLRAQGFVEAATAAAAA